MVPLGISAAAAVSVGQAIGRGHLRLARRSGFVAAALACVFMACAAIVFLVVPRQILGIYTSDAQVIATGTSLLVLAAGFQLFDGIQTVTTGALRGAGKTRVPMLMNLCGYWLFGLPIGYALCFNFHQGVFGLWWGLTVGLAVISIILLYEWSQASKHLERFTRSALQPTPEA
jgi:MATE family multidrug resistance protein